MDFPNKLVLFNPVNCDYNQNQIRISPLHVFNVLLNSAARYKESCEVDGRGSRDQTSHISHSSWNIIYSPCGKILLSHIPYTPILYRWYIKVHKNMMVNVTVHRLVLAYEDLLCTPNYLMLMNRRSGSILGKICGRSSGKIFYSPLIFVLFFYTHRNSYPCWCWIS